MSSILKPFFWFVAFPFGNMPLEDQVEFLATQWMSVKQLTETGVILNCTQPGIPCHKGQFTKEETQTIHDTIQTYQTPVISVQENNLDDKQLDDMIHSAEPAKGFWSYIACAVPQRGVKSIFYHVRRACDSLGKVGKWSTAEDQQLQMAMQSHGKDWTAIADFVQRIAADCSDRFRQHIQYKEMKRTGAWSSDEESQLVHAMEYWLRVVNRTCRLQDSGFLCQKQWMGHRHLSNVKVNGLRCSKGKHKGISEAVLDKG
ncbi:hypothetical protein EI94DRAFT_1707345 [Lactarius quietus]|nr:hypothetical protein EI94DRAFT_1707345 [Lactarius quietus]